LCFFHFHFIEHVKQTELTIDTNSILLNWLCVFRILECHEFLREQMKEK
jgi:hypothetical protein